MIIGILAGLALATDADAELAQLREEVAELRAELEARHEAPPAVDAPDRVHFTGPVVVAAGEVVETAVSFTGDVEIHGRVTGKATAFGGDVIVADGGVVEGDATSFGGSVVRAPGAVIRGDARSFGVADLRTEIGPEVHALQDHGPSFASLLYRRLVLTLSLAGAGVLAVGVFPLRVAQVASAIERRPFHSAAVGALGTGFIALFAVLLTVVTLGLGLPVALLLIGALSAAWMLGFVGLCQAVGDHLPFRQRPHGRWVAFLVGVLLLTSVGSLPWVGWPIIAAAGILGVGASLSTRFGADLRAR